MGDLPAAGWKSSLVGLALVVVFLVVGIRYGGQPAKPVKVDLACTVTDGQYVCERR